MVNMIVKVHNSENGTVVAVCDSDLIGKKFEEGNLQLDLTSDFYKGQEKSEKEIGDLLRNAYIINVVGKKSVELAIKEKVIDESSVKKIANIHYSQGVIEH